MPQLTVAASGGSPVLAANVTRTLLLIQNNSAKDVRMRIMGPVALASQTQSGLLLRAQGGFLQLAGVDAQRPLYAITADGSSVTVDYETDVPA